MQVVHVGLKMPVTLKNKIRKWAKKEKLPMSAWIRNLIEREDRRLRETDKENKEREV